jgi:hypothetical protein
VPIEQWVVRQMGCRPCIFEQEELAILYAHSVAHFRHPVIIDRPDETSVVITRYNRNVAPAEFDV